MIFLGNFQLLTAQPRGGGQNQEPVIGRETPVTSRAQLGVVKNSLVILCPEQNKTIDLSARTPGRLTAQAHSADPSVATATVSVNQRNHAVLTINAGENDSEQDRITTVTVTITHEVLQTGIPAAPPAGSFDDGYGINGSGPNSQPHGVSGRADRTSTGTITVRVLPSKVCSELPEEDTVGAITPPAAQNMRNLRLCVQGTRNLNMQNEITIQPNRMHRTDRNRTPRLRGLRIDNNTNPAIASAEVMGRGAQDPVYLLFRGLAPGETLITVSEYPLPANVVPFRHTYRVIVEECSDEELGRFIRQWSAVPHGYQVMPDAQPVQRESWLDEEDEEKTPNEDQSSSGNKFVEDGQLARLTGTVGGSELAIQCPADTQQGDIISCSVISDGQPASGGYQSYAGNDPKHVQYDDPSIPR